MANSTPGPWIAERVKARGGPKDWWGVYANEAPQGARMPAECHGPDAKANAKLIAAAPALADALQAIVEAYEGNVEQSSLLAGAAAALRAAGRLP